MTARTTYNLLTEKWVILGVYQISNLKASRHTCKVFPTTLCMPNILQLHFELSVQCSWRNIREDLKRACNAHK